MTTEHTTLHQQDYVAAVQGRPKDMSKREAILQAARCLFMQQGFQRTSMDAIAAAAEVSKLTVYSHFQNKDSLFKQVIIGKCSQYNRYHDAHTWSTDDIRTTLLEIGSGFTCLVTSDDALALYRVIISEAEHHPKIAELFYEAGPERMKQQFQAWLLQLQQQNLMREGNIEAATDTFFCMLKGDIHFKMLLNLAVSPSKESIDKHVTHCIDMFMRAWML